MNQLKQAQRIELGEFESSEYTFNPCHLSSPDPHFLLEKSASNHSAEFKVAYSLPRCSWNSFSPDLFFWSVTPPPHRSIILTFAGCFFLVGSYSNTWCYPLCCFWVQTPFHLLQGMACASRRWRCRRPFLRWGKQITDHEGLGIYILLTSRIPPILISPYGASSDCLGLGVHTLGVWSVGYRWLKLLEEIVSIC